MAANPQMAVFQVREGHVQLNHTYTHPHLNQLVDAAVIDEVLRTERLFDAIGAPLTFKGFRPPFFEAERPRPGADPRARLHAVARRGPDRRLGSGA